MLQPNSNLPNPEHQRRERDRQSLEIRTKYDPEAIKHAAMLCLQNSNAKKVHKKILDDENNGDIFMEAFESRAKEPATKMPILTATAFVINQVKMF